MHPLSAYITDGSGAILTYEVVAVVWAGGHGHAEGAGSAARVAYMVLPAALRQAGSSRERTEGNE